MPKNTTLCPQIGLEPVPIALELNALTMRPLRLPIFVPSLREIYLFGTKYLFKQSLSSFRSGVTQTAQLNEFLNLPTILYRDWWSSHTLSLYNESFYFKVISAYFTSAMKIAKISVLLVKFVTSFKMTDDVYTVV